MSQTLTSGDVKTLAGRILGPLGFERFRVEIAGVDLAIRAEQHGASLERRAHLRTWTPKDVERTAAELGRALARQLNRKTPKHGR